MKKVYWIVIILAVALCVVSVRLAYNINDMKENKENTADTGMSVIECIMSRASVRKYQNKEVPDSLVKVLLKAGMAAPSAMNKQPWAFVVVQKREILEKIEKEMPNVHSAKAPLAIVVCGNLNNAIEGEGESYWIQDCSAATQNILLAAHASGLGAVWCGITPISERVAKTKELLDLPSALEPLCIICIGWPDGNAAPKDKWTEDNVLRM